MATIGELRARYRELRQTADSLAKLGYTGLAAPLIAEADRMASTDYTIDVMCVACDQPKPASVRVTDEAVPRVQLCGDCSLRSTIAVIRARSES